MDWWRSEWGEKDTRRGLIVQFPEDARRRIAVNVIQSLIEHGDFDAVDTAALEIAADLVRGERA